MEETNVIKTEECIMGMADEFVDTGVSWNEFSCYARFFDVESKKWNVYADSHERLFFLKTSERFANDLLRTNGYLYLNDVYEMLGLQTSKEFKDVGWRYLDNNPIGDNYVSFNIYNDYNYDFINGWRAHQVLLDFNVDGYIGRKNT